MLHGRFQIMCCQAVAVAPSLTSAGCGVPAAVLFACSGLFSLRRVGTGPQEVVGGDEAYLATCRRCYLEHGGQLQ
jgi:thymidine kinase